MQKNIRKSGRQNTASMPNSASAQHAEMIKVGHMQTDSADWGLLRAVDAYRAVKFEQTYFIEIDI